MWVCVTSYPYLSTLEAKKAPRMLPTEAQALHRPNTNPRLKGKKKKKNYYNVSSLLFSKFYSVKFLLNFCENCFKCKENVIRWQTRVCQRTIFVFQVQWLWKPESKWRLCFDIWRCDKWASLCELPKLGVDRKSSKVNVGKQGVVLLVTESRVTRKRVSRAQKCHTPRLSEPVGHDSHHAGPHSRLQQPVQHPQAAVQVDVVDVEPFSQSAKDKLLQTDTHLLVNITSSMAA